MDPDPSSHRAGFDRAASNFKTHVPKALIDQFAADNDSLASLKGEIDAIQKEHGREGKLRNMRRAGKFIEAMNQFGQGPMKFLLGIAKTHIDIFDKLMGAYDRIGDEIPEWAQLFHSTWKTFNSQFDPILQSMRSRRELVESGKLSASLEEIQEAREKINDVYQRLVEQENQQAHDRHLSKINRIKERLCSPDYSIDQYASTEDRQATQTGQWIFQEPKYTSWVDLNSPEAPIICLNGIPGAEKLLNRKFTSQLPAHSVAYFYFKHGNTEKNNHNSFLRAFLLQLMDQNRTVSHEFAQELSAKADVAIRATNSLETLVKRALEEYPTSFLVLDGLDECAAGEARKTVQWLLSLVGDISDIRVIFSGQRDGLLDVLLSDRPSIPLESSHHAQDIQNFCRSRCKQLRTSFKGMEASLEEQIFTLVTTRAKGMFLYARVVLQNLSDQISLTGLKHEVQTGVFPADIDAAVITEAPIAKQRGAKKVLGLVIAARRDLRWREIQSLFYIDSTQGTIDHESRCQITSKELCGSLVDTHYINGASTPPEALVRIVHETAKTYLIQNAIVNVAIENAKMAKFLTNYLVTSPFENTRSSDDILLQARNGYYSLQDYAVQYWYHHCQALAGIAGKSSLHQTTHLDKHLREMSCSLQQFVHFYSKFHASNSQIDEAVASQESLSAVLAKVPEDEQERTSHFNLVLRTTFIRNEIESLELLEDAQRAVLDDLHGPINLFKCHKPWCPRFTDGFNTSEERANHMNRHDRPFQCQYENCIWFSLGFETEADAQGHHADYHSEATENIQFPTSVRKQASKLPGLLQAAKDGDIASVKSYLDSGQDINLRRVHKSFKTPLCGTNGNSFCCAQRRRKNRGFAPSPRTDLKRAINVMPINSFMNALSENHEESTQLMLEILLSTGRPTKLETMDLVELQKVALRGSHSEIVDFIEGILVSRRKESESETQKVSVTPALYIHLSAENEVLITKQVGDRSVALPSIRDMLGETFKQPASPS
ncbi:zinc finger protein [Colletotrichum sojae]|uniref:Zinc finger protein n=1 Tax=Colletotrichum sojae TaxID=2175907 RepID=A0A8H6MU47_9PEZI|nr:zinc finger protein [Colletotrichum sojae]